MDIQLIYPTFDSTFDFIQLTIQLTIQLCIYTIQLRFNYGPKFPITITTIRKWDDSTLGCIVGCCTRSVNVRLKLDDVSSGFCLSRERACTVYDRFFVTLTICVCVCIQVSYFNIPDLNTRLNTGLFWDSQFLKFRIIYTNPPQASIRYFQNLFGLG